MDLAQARASGMGLNAPFLCPENQQDRKSRENSRGDGFQTEG